MKRRIIVILIAVAALASAAVVFRGPIVGWVGGLYQLRPVLDSKRKSLDRAVGGLRHHRGSHHSGKRPVRRPVGRATW